MVGDEKYFVHFNVAMLIIGRMFEHEDEDIDELKVYEEPFFPPVFGIVYSYWFCNLSSCFTKASGNGTIVTTIHFSRRYPACLFESLATR